MPKFNNSTHFHLKYPLRVNVTQDTQVSHNWQCSLFRSKFLFRFLLFNPTIENEKVTDK